MALHHAIGRAAISNQGSLIVAVVLLAFIVYVTLQGHLAGYLADLGFGAKARAKAVAGNAAGGLLGGGAGNLFGPGNSLIPNIPVPSLPQVPGT